MQEGKTPASVAETVHHIKACHRLFGRAHGRQAGLGSGPPIILRACKDVFKGALVAQQPLTLVGSVRSGPCDPGRLEGGVIAKATKNELAFPAGPVKSGEVELWYPLQFLRLCQAPFAIRMTAF